MGGFRLSTIMQIIMAMVAMWLMFITKTMASPTMTIITMNLIMNMAITRLYNSNDRTEQLSDPVTYYVNVKYCKQLCVNR